jgi:hypothetical protein
LCKILSITLRASAPAAFPAPTDCKLVKADDAWMPADFLTKWLSSAKLAKSIAYATNRRNAVAPNAHAS